jgi:hypothetical protein
MNTEEEETKGETFFETENSEEADAPTHARYMTEIK